MAIVSMNVSVTGAGTVPLGAIVPVGNVGAWALPASGEIKDGFVLCDGTAFPAGSHPSFAGNRPNLTDDRFLNGTTAALGPGANGGTTSKTTTGVSASFNKNVLNTDQTAHSHAHPYFQSSSSFGPIYTATTINGSSYSSYFGTRAATVVGAVQIVPSGTTTVPLSVITFNEVSKDTISWTSATVNTSATQGTISDIRPNYFSVVYLMRVI